MYDLRWAPNVETRPDGATRSGARATTDDELGRTPSAWAEVAGRAPRPVHGSRAWAAASSCATSCAQLDADGLISDFSSAHGGARPATWTSSHRAACPTAASRVRWNATLARGLARRAHQPEHAAPCPSAWSATASGAASLRPAGRGWQTTRALRRHPDSLTLPEDDSGASTDDHLGADTAKSSSARNPHSSLLNPPAASVD